MWLFSPRKARRTAQPVRPVLERLEDRTVPASLSYLSTSLNAVVYGTAVDAAGNAYVTGQASTSLPTTPGAFMTSGSGAFVAKLNPTGALVYATFLGGGIGTGIAVDAAGDAWVIGADGNVPTTANAMANDSSGTADFVAELNPTGSGLNYATYLPGTIDGYLATFSYAGAIALDGSGNIYVAGAAEGGLPVTAGAFQTTYLGGSGRSDPFFMKINPALSGAASVVYATYLGGSSGVDTATGIALDGSGNAYLEGYTQSGDFPTTSGAFQRQITGLAAFVAKLDPALSGAASLVYSTYLGTAAAGYVSNDGYITDTGIAGGIAVDSAGDAYVTSATTETDFPTTAGAYQTKSNIHASPPATPKACDVFVTKLNATGSALVYSTYLGGGTNGKNGGTSSGGASIAVDPSGDAYVTGWTNSTSFPTRNPVQSTNNSGGFDDFVTVLNPAGSGLLFSTYLGSGRSNAYYGNGIALDSAGNAYVGGAIASASSVFSLPGNGFLAKIDPPADVSDVSVPITTDGTPVAAGIAFISGTDAHLLIGNGGDAIPMSGSTASDANEAALAAILAEWNSGHNFATRVANPTDQSSSPGLLARLNVPYLLLDSGHGETAFDDSSARTPTGSSDSDWFFAGTAEQVANLSTRDLTFILGV
jgi:hypothetical protein